MKVYEALFNSMVWESSYETLSIHRTKEGAEKAIERSKAKEKDGMEGWADKDRMKDWDRYYDWIVVETEVEE